MADSGTPTTASGTKRPAPTPSPAPPLGDSSSFFASATKRPSIDGAGGAGSGGGTKAAAARASPVAARASPTGSTGSSSAADKSSNSSRGLRHFSMMVCQKVEEKGTTTYNEVADELVKKVIAERRKEDPNGKFDEKNIRRRVYDALNVLMAMDIIAKEKKDITWKGLPTAAKQDMDVLQQEIDYRRYQLEHKKEALKELLTQQVCFRNLVLRNHQGGAPDDDKIPLPFIVVNTHSSAVIQCDMSRDRTDVMFDFSMPFEINDDNTILKKMGM